MDIKEERLRAAYDYTMVSYQGRQFVWEMLSLTNVFAMLPDDTNAMLRHEGMRRLGLLMMSELENRCPEKYFLMMTEGKQRNKENENADRRIEDDRNDREDRGLEDGGSANIAGYDDTSISGI